MSKPWTEKEGNTSEIPLTKGQQKDGGNVVRGKIERRPVRVPGS